MGIQKVVLVSFLSLCLFSTYSLQNVLKHTDVHTEARTTTGNTTKLEFVDSNDEAEVLNGDKDVINTGEANEEVIPDTDEKNLIPRKGEVIPDQDNVEHDEDPMLDPEESALKTDTVSTGETVQTEPIPDMLETNAEEINENLDTSVKSLDHDEPDKGVVDINNKDTAPVEGDKGIVDTSVKEPDPVKLRPEDEDMVIMQIRELGGILDEKEIAEIDQEENTLEDTEGGISEEELKFEPIPMPTDFESYDRNRDGLIEMEELTDVTGAFENVADAFIVCDKNGDGFIDPEEFRKAPWDLSGKPPEVVKELI